MARAVVGLGVVLRVSTGTCTCCGKPKSGAGRGLCLACAQCGGVKDTPHSCHWCSARDYEKDFVRRMKKPGAPPLQGRDQRLLGSGG